LGLFRKSAKSWVNKGLAQAAKGEYEEALDSFDKALEMDPNLAEALYNKGCGLYCLGKSEEALIYFDKAVETNPDEDKAWYDKGTCLDSLRRYQEAITCYDRAIDIDSRYVKAFNNKGAALKKLGRYEEALDNFQKAVDIANFREALYNKGTTLQELGRHSEAVDTFRFLIERLKGSMDKGNLSSMEALIERTKQNEVVENISKVMGFSESILELETLTDEGLERHGFTRESFFQFKEVFPLYLKGLSLREAGLLPKALEMIKEFLRRSPQECEVINREAQLILEELKEDIG